jgi:SAM-dependent methyltransferase
LPNSPVKSGRSFLSWFDRLYLYLFYLKRLRTFDLPENQVGWRSRKNQELRFQAFLDLGDLNQSKILDLGCGLGCFFQFLKDRDGTGGYTGMDVLGMMVQKARLRFPETRFERRDILKNPPAEQWDYVFISGVFNHKVKDNWAWMDQLVPAAFALARKGLAFNVLSSEAGWWDPELFYANPIEMERKVKEWSAGKYKMVKGYLPEDMTFYLYQ